MLRTIIKDKATHYFLIAGASFILDFIIFSVIAKLSLNNDDSKIVFTATISARLISSFFNYFMNRNFVFMNKNKVRIDRNSMVKYYSLVAFQALMSFVVVNLFNKISKIDILWIKIIVDFAIFIGNYFIQRYFVFNDNKIILFSKLNQFIKNNILFCIVLVFALIMQILSLKELGFRYTLNSDDLSYVYSGITFSETGEITMHGVKSAQIMPFMPIFIGIIASIFKIDNLWIVLKIVWVSFSLVTLLYVYLISIRLTKNKILSILPVIMLLTPDFIWMNNLILTETPYMMFIAIMFYHTFNILDKNSSQSNFYIILFSFLCALMLKANVGVYVIIMVVYLLLNKYDLKLLLKQLAKGFIIVLLILTPWWIRNYSIFNEFIPLTYGSGNPLLLGTYQGVNILPDDKENLNKYVSKKMVKYDYALSNSSMQSFYALKKDEYAAKFRISKWFETNPRSFIASYAYHKPRILFKDMFYWQEIFNFKRDTLFKIRKFQLTLFIIGSISYLCISVFRKKINIDMLLLFSFLMSQIVVYSLTFAFGRYSQTILFIIYIITVHSFYGLWKFCQNNIDKERNIL